MRTQFESFFGVLVPDVEDSVHSNWYHSLLKMGAHLRHKSIQWQCAEATSKLHNQPDCKAHIHEPLVLLQKTGVKTELRLQVSDEEINTLEVFSIHSSL